MDKLIIVDAIVIDAGSKIISHRTAKSLRHKFFVFSFHLTIVKELRVILHKQWYELYNTP